MVLGRRWLKSAFSAFDLQALNEPGVCELITRFYTVDKLSNVREVVKCELIKGVYLVLRGYTRYFMNA